MSGMSRKEIARLLDHIQPQGVNVTRTTKGLLLRMPDGKGTAMVHFSGSDHRQRAQLRADLRRAGITFPGDHSPLPDYITSGKVLRSTRERAARALEGWEQRAINGAQLSRLMEAQGDKPLTTATAQKVLYQLGWTPQGDHTARKWLRPLELEPDPVHLFPQPEQPDTEPEQPDTEPEPDPEPEPEPEISGDRNQLAEPVLRVEGREFLDSVASWAADPALIPDTLTLGEMWRLLAALGLSGELRVWRNI